MPFVVRPWNYNLSDSVAFTGTSSFFSVRLFISRGRVLPATFCSVLTQDVYEQGYQSAIENDIIAMPCSCAMEMFSWEISLGCVIQTFYRVYLARVSAE